MEQINYIFLCITDCKIKMSIFLTLNKKERDHLLQFICPRSNTLCLYLLYDDQFHNVSSTLFIISLKTKRKEQLL